MDKKPTPEEREVLYTIYTCKSIKGIFGLTNSSGLSGLRSGILNSDLTFEISFYLDAGPSTPLIDTETSL